MKFLVTGATSGLGRNAVEWLLKEGYQVRATGRNHKVGQELLALGAEFMKLDLITASDQEYELLLSGCDFIWHCAALSSPWGKYDWFYQANVVVTSRLSEWAGRLAIKRFIHVSTPSIYFDFKSHLNIPESYVAKRFANHYADTKYLAEKEIQNCALNFLDTKYIIIRPRGLFGPHDRVIAPRVIELIKRTNGMLPLPAGGKAYVDLTFVLNVVHALFIATENSSLNSGEVFNITNQQPCYLNELLYKLLHDKLNINYQVYSVPYKFMYGIASSLELSAKLTKKEPTLTRYSVGTLFYDMTLCQKNAINRLGYIPKYSLTEGIDITANWLQRGLQNG